MWEPQPCPPVKAQGHWVILFTDFQDMMYCGWKNKELIVQDKILQEHTQSKAINTFYSMDKNERLFLIMLKSKW